MVNEGAGDRARSPARVATQLRQLQVFVKWDQVACALGVIFLLLVRLFLSDSNYLVLLAGMVFAVGVAIGTATKALQRADIPLAILRIAIPNWLIAPGATSVMPWVEPVLLITAQLPTMLAVPHVSLARLRVSAMFSAISAMAVAAVARLQDFSHATDQLPSWVPEAVTIGFMPVMVALVCLIVVQNSQMLEDLLARALAAMTLLTSSERTLKEQAAELRASRRRIVTAGDEVRRRIERDIHDGAQQRLLGVVMQLGLVRDLTHEDPDAADRVLLQLERETLDALADLRNLANGVYPPVLIDHGVAEALSAATTSLGSRVQLDFDHIGRFAPDIESTVYFCCLEAVQNAVKHGGLPSTITISLAHEPDGLVFEVRDDGDGFDVDQIRKGNGFTNFNDRLSAVGGTVAIHSAVGDGTVIRGRLPL